MCGRYYVDNEEEIIEMREILDKLNRKYYGDEKLASMKTGEIYPTDVAPVLSEDGPELMAWGFPIQNTSRTVINARGESAFEKPMFAKALSSRRVVVPTTGFFEWSHTGKKAKNKFLFRLPGEKMLYLAGLYTEYDLPAGRERRFVILTAIANDSMRPYHDRMPVILGPDERDAWIGGGAFVSEALNRPQPELFAALISPAKEDPTQMSLF